MAEANNRKQRSRTNWKRIDALKDSEIDFSDIQKLGHDFFAHAIRWPDEKQQITSEGGPAHRTND